MEGGETPGVGTLSKVAQWFEDDGLKMVDDMKRFRLGAREQVILPANSANNKYMRT